MSSKTNNESAGTVDRHTPGPWSVESPHGNVRANVEQPRSGTPLNTHIFLAELDNGTTYGERIANARLAACAPDLLAALRALLSVCDEELDPKRCPEMGAARAALARAGATP